MRAFRSRLMVTLLALAATSCAGAMTWMAYRHDPRGPQTAGTVELPGLSAAAEVLRDKWGIPHVFASSELDLMRAMGYVHAQDRLFQMDIIRRTVRGELSEIFGDRPMEGAVPYGAKTMLEHDAGMRILGFGQGAEIFLEIAPPETKALLDAYAQGVNAYIAQHQGDLPVEFGLIGYEPRLWKPDDTIAMERFIGWLLATNAPLELIQAAADVVLGPEKGARLLPPADDGRDPRILPDYRFPAKKPSIAFDPKPLAPLDKTQLSLSSLYRLLNVGNGQAQNVDASNNWVVSGARSVSGKPILANDPHLPHLAPSIFHLIHLSGDGYDTIGASFPGIPMVILGHNRHVAWAATNNQADVQDLYLHKVDPARPSRYLYRDKWEDFVERDETIYVKEGHGRRVVKFTVRTSRFGPVISDVYAKDRGGDVVSLRWTGMDIMGDPDAYWALQNAPTAEARQAVAAKYWGDGRGDDMHAFRQVNRAGDCDEYFKAMSRFGTPRQNWLCADDAGHIGYAVAGFVPVRNRGDGLRIARAWLDEGRWIAFVPYAEIPQRRNPKSGYILSANNVTMDLDAYPYPWAYHYSTPYRAMRIKELLTAEPKVDAAVMKRIQGDRASKMAADFVPLFVQAAKDDEALTDARVLLDRWDKNATEDSAGAALFYVAMHELVRKIFADELGPDLYAACTATDQTVGPMLQIARDKKHPFHDSVKSPSAEKWAVTYRRALSAAYARLQRELGADPQAWKWGALHTMTSRHPLGSEKAIAASVNIGPHPHGGGPDTVWVAGFRVGHGDVRADEGPAYRHIVDLADPAHAWVVLDTGNWGQPLTKSYTDLHDLWRQNLLAQALLNRADIEEQILGVLTLEPAQLP
jgi:penicillin amidase